jgi:hypothetical protein
MRSTDDIRRFIDKGAISTNPTADKAVLDAVLMAGEKAVDETSATTKPSVGSIVMRNSYVKLALAAVVVLAVVVGVSEFLVPSGRAGVAWAGVAEKLGHISDYVYRERRIESIGVRTPGFELSDESETWWYWSSEFGSRWDQCHAKKLTGQYYRAQRQQRSVWIQTTRKTYCTRPDPIAAGVDLNPAGQMCKILAEPYVKLGRTTIDGILVEGIEVQGQKIGVAKLDNAVSRLWVNVQTELPVWLESEGDMHGSDVHCRQIQDQFQWNPNLTEADFTPVIPPDFVQEEWPSPDAPKRADIAAAAAQKDVVIDFSRLLALGLAGNEQPSSQPTITVTGIKEINDARDQVMSAWPKYAELQVSLRQELDQKLNLKSCSVDELVQLGVLLREKYWDVGGDFSPASYRYGYMARMLLESAYAREPNDLAIGDELAETIMATQTTGCAQDFWEVLTGLRTAQFHQIRTEVERGRRPVWEDFARVDDLIYLYAEPAERAPIIDWLTGHAQAGGWTSYLSLLDWMRANAVKGRLGYTIYTAAGSAYPEEFRYGGRLPSFKGPQKRAVVPSRPPQSQPAQQQTP